MTATTFVFIFQTLAILVHLSRVISTRISLPALFPSRMIWMVLLVLAHDLIVQVRIPSAIHFVDLLKINSCRYCQYVWRCWPKWSPDVMHAPQA
jgi:hypothetical protein